MAVESEDGSAVAVLEVVLCRATAAGKEPESAPALVSSAARPAGGASGSTSLDVSEAVASTEGWLAEALVVGC